MGMDDDPGFAIQFSAESPPLDEDATLAMHCWCWCQGWAPAQWPVYDALYAPPDWHITIELMESIRDHVRRKDHPQR